MATHNEAQRKFDEQYITCSEIMKTLNVARSTILFARRAGRLPDPIDVSGNTYIWERSKITEYLKAWKTILDTRRGITA